jgi:leucyl-tRNA synthetase
MGPLADEKPWNPRDIAGCRRFLERVWRLFVDEQEGGAVRPELAQSDAEPDAELERALQRALKRVDEAFEGLNLNTAIAALMSFTNEATKRPGALGRSQAERLCLLLAPFAPHLAEELWSRLGHERSLGDEPWPEVDPRWLEEDEVEIAVQVKGKLRGRTRVPRTATQAEVEAAARAAVAPVLQGAEVVKAIYVPGKLVNLLTR